MNSTTLVTNWNDSSQPPAEQVGGLIGPYRLLEPLGRGGMGVVFRAAHTETQQQVALKTVRVAHQRALSALRREIQTLAQARHPQIVRILDEGLENGLPWYAMELLEGTTLRHLAWDPSGSRDTPPLPASRGDRTTRPAETRRTVLLPSALPDESSGMPRFKFQRPLAPILNLIRQLCAPLAFLHGEGIVHCDLKPDNILLRSEKREARSEESNATRTERQAASGIPTTDPTSSSLASRSSLLTSPVLLDFGLVAQFGGTISRELLEPTSPGVGTIAYMAPEQVRGELLDARTDLYALGCILYELICGRPPFQGATAVQVLWQHVSAQPKPPSHWADSVPPVLDELVLRLLSKQPRHRLGHADDVAAVLEALGARDPFLEGLPRPKAYLYRSGFVGRAQVFDSLGSRLERLGNGSGGVVAIGGESGAGKTRFVLELARLAEQNGMIVLAGQCFEGSMRLFEGLRRPLRVLADLCRERGPAETQRVLGPRSRVLAPYEPALTGLPGLESEPELSPLPPEFARLRLLDAFSECLVRQAEEAPILLILDDLQWADELTSDWLLHLLQSRRAGLVQDARVLIVGTYRSEDRGASGFLQEWLGQTSVDSVLLGRLDQAAVSTMISDMLALPTVPQNFSRYLMLRSEGNAFFIAEYLRSALAEGLLWRDVDGQWQAGEAGQRAATETDYQRLPLPGSVRELVEHRLSRLSHQEYQIVEVAALIGRELSPSLLDRVLTAVEGTSLGSWSPVVTQLMRRQILVERELDSVQFVHDQFREVAVEKIPASRRVVLHAAVAEAIEALYEKDERLAELAHHWEAAGEPDRARPLYLAAARKAKSRFGNDESERLYRAYLRQPLASLDENLQVRVELGAGILLQQGRHQDCREELERALQMAQASWNPGLEALVLNALGFSCIRTNWLESGVRYCQLALEKAEAAGDPKHTTMAHQNLAQLYWQEGRLEMSLRHAQQAVERLGQSANLAQRSESLQMMAMLEGDLGRLESSHDLYRQALALYREGGYRQSEGILLGNLGVADYYRGDLEKADRLYQEALAIHQETGARHSESSTLASVALLRADQGRVEEALEIGRQAASMLEEMGERRVRGFVLTVEGALHRRLGRWDEAQHCLRQAESCLREAKAWPLLIHCLCERGHLELALGRPAAEIAEEIQRQSSSLGGHLGAGPQLAVSRFSRAVVAAAESRDLFRGELASDIPRGLWEWIQNRLKT